MKKIRLTLLSCVISALFLAGCTPVNVNKQLYALNATVMIPKTKYHSAQTILVLKTQASPELDTKKMLYVTSEHKIGYYSKHGWVAKPAEMLLPEIAQTIRNLHYFKAVTQVPFVGVTDYRLATQLITLQQNFLTKPSQISMTLAAQLSDANTGKVIAAQEFHAVVPAPGNDPYSGVISANIATSQILNQLAKFCVTASQHYHPGK